MGLLQNGLAGMGGLGALGGMSPPAGLLKNYDPTQLRNQMIKRGLLEAGIKMMSTPGKFGAAVGPAFAGGLEGADAARTGYMQDAFTMAQLEEKNRAQQAATEQEQKVQSWLNTLSPEDQAMAEAFPDQYATQFLQSKFATGGSGASGVFGNVLWDQKGNPYALDKSGKQMNRIPVEGGATLIPPPEMTGLREQAKIGPKATSAMVDEWFKKDGIRDKTASATAALQSIQQAKQMLQRGIQTGAGAEIINSWRNAGKTLGFTVDETTLSNTQSYQDFIMNTVVPRMKELGGNDSEEELRAMMRTTGGDISRQPEVLARTLELIERALQRNVAEGAAVYEQIKPFVGDYNPVYSQPSQAFPDGNAPDFSKMSDDELEAYINGQ